MNGKVHKLDPEHNGAALRLDETSDPQIAQMMHDLVQFREDKGWGNDDPLKNLAVALNVEASELMDIFTWHNDDETPSAEMKAHAAEELADVMIYAFFMCSRLGLDPLKVIRAKHEINEGRSWQ